MKHNVVLSLLLLIATAGGTACTEPSAEERALSKVWVVHVDRPNDTLPLLRGTEEWLTASAFDSAGVLVTVPLPFEWTSSDPSVIDVDQQGRISAKRPGYVDVFARLPNGVFGRRSLTAADPLTVFVAIPDSARLLVGQRRPLILQYLSKPTVVPVQGWTSSNPNVVTVDDKGVVTAVSPGSATVSAGYAGSVFRSEVYVADVPMPLRFASVAAGGSASCGLTPDGAAYCWGASNGGALGTTDRLDRCVGWTYYLWPAGSPPPHGSWKRLVTPCAMEPVRVETPIRFASLDVQGTMACGLTSGGEGYCWGATGALTGGQSSPRVVPVSTQLRFSSFNFPCGVTIGNEAWCFGEPSLRGAPATAGTAPTQVTGGAIWSSVTGGAGLFTTRHRCGLTTDGVVRCWGGNARGKLGTGDTITSPLPVPVQSTERFSSVDVNYEESCAVSTTQLLYCWGIGRLTPTAMSTTLHFVAVTMSAGGGVCALGTDGNTYCRQADNTMAIGFGGLRYHALGLAERHACGVRDDGLTYCWGYNAAGQLGTGDDVEYKSTPALVLGQ